MPELKRATAEPGAPAPDGFIPLSVPELGAREWEYVRECLETNWVSSVGPFVDRFEQAMVARIGARHAVATVSGTAALHVALLAAGIQPDDEVIVPALTFIAPANAVRYAAAWPVFVDVEPEYWQIDPLRVAAFLDTGCRTDNGHLVNKSTGRPVRAIIVVHVLGHPVDADPILQLAQRYGLTVIEDAAESLGAAYKDRRVGALGHLSCFSFNGNKVVTAGGGGMLMTDDAAIAERARYLTTQAKDDPVEYVHHEVGFNYRLTNVLAAVGCAQLERLDEYVAVKRRITDRYVASLAGVPGLSVMRDAPWAFSARWMTTVVVDADRFGIDSRELMRRLHALRIQSRPLWQPLHRSVAHAGATVVGGEVADRLHRDCLSLPSSVGLSTADQERVLDAVKAIAR